MIDDDGRFQCTEDRYWDDELNYYHWEDCLFLYSGTHGDDSNLGPAMTIRR